MFLSGPLEDQPVSKWEMLYTIVFQFTLDINSENFGAFKAFLEWYFLIGGGHYIKVVQCN